MFSHISMTIRTVHSKQAHKSYVSLSDTLFHIQSNLNVLALLHHNIFMVLSIYAPYISLQKIYIHKKIAQAYLCLLVLLVQKGSDHIITKFNLHLKTLQVPSVDGMPRWPTLWHQNWHPWTWSSPEDRMKSITMHGMHCNSSKTN